MIYIPNKHEGDQIYERYTRDLGLARKINHPDKKKDFEYHVTLGFIEGVGGIDTPDLAQYLQQYLESYIKPTSFEFGVASLLGQKSLYIVALPKNPKVFIEYNEHLANLLKSYKDGKYSLSKFTKPGRYVPHLSLNGEIGKNISIENLADTLSKINNKMLEVKITLTKIVIR
jgi:hypothetical protein